MPAIIVPTDMHFFLEATHSCPAIPATFADGQCYVYRGTKMLAAHMYVKIHFDFLWVVQVLNQGSHPQQFAEVHHELGSVQVRSLNACMLGLDIPTLGFCK